MFAVPGPAAESAVSNIECNSRFPWCNGRNLKVYDIVSAREEANVVWMNYGWTTAAPPRDNSSQPFKYPGFAPWRDSEAESWVSLSNKYARDHILIKSCVVTHSFGSHSFRSLHFIDVYEFVKSMMNMFRFAVQAARAVSRRPKRNKTLSLETVDSQRYLWSLSKENMPFASPNPGRS